MTTTSGIFYDAQGNLIAVTWENNTGSLFYYRFVHVNAGKVYFERTTLPYNDPTAVVTSRIILEFDANDNIIKAGRDSDLDNVANWEHAFNYDNANNLTNVAEYGGILLFRMRRLKTISLN